MTGSCRVLVCTLVVGLFCGQSAAQTTRPGAKPVQLKHLKIDRAKRQIVIAAAVAQRQVALEFLLCTERTKDHESLLTTRAKPSSLHAGLLLLGLAPGKPARWTNPVDGKPVFLPPKGAMLEITLRWKDEKGVLREAPPADWMLAVATKKRPDPTQWVFVGSDVLDDGRYWADIEGHHISVANFASSVIDVPFRSTDQDALREFTANPATVPPKGTAVEVVITAAKDAEKAADARITFAIDAFGRIAVNGNAAPAEKIPEIVKRFLSHHAKAAAEVRIDPRALVVDRERLKAILEEAGLSEITFRVRGLTDEILPRSPEEAGEAIEYWKKQFARADELIGDPGEDAEIVLKHIQRRRKQLEQLSELWADYAARLRALLAEYEALRARRKQPDS